MRVHYIEVEPKQEQAAASRITVGGSPIVSLGQDWPECGLCKAPMVFFFQLDIDKSSDLQLKPGSHLLVFMCPIHNDIPSRLMEYGDRTLPEKDWDWDFGHYALILNKPSKTEVKLDQANPLQLISFKYRELEEVIDWDGRTERGSAGFKLGGVPLWEGEAEFPTCCCGAEMVFVCQVPPGFGFPKLKGAAEQAECLMPGNYYLFMGLSVYLFACKDQCTPRSLYPVAQDIIEDQILSG